MAASVDLLSSLTSTAEVVARFQQIIGQGRNTKNNTSNSICPPNPPLPLGLEAQALTANLGSNGSTGWDLDSLPENLDELDPNCCGGIFNCKALVDPDAPT